MLQQPRPRFQQRNRSNRRPDTVHVAPPGRTGDFVELHEEGVGLYTFESSSLAASQLVMKRLLARDSKVGALRS